MNPTIGEIPPSIIRSLNSRKRPDDLDLGLGEPTLRPDMGPFAEAVEWTRAHGCPYSPNAGFAELRELIAKYLAEGEWLEGGPRPEQICVTVGSEEAIYLAIKSVVDPARDEVLVVEPCYLAYPKICMLEGVRHRSVPLPAEADFAPTASTILDAIGPATRLIIINSPANPTGRVWPAGELRALAEGLRERGGREIYILSDEVYRELYYGSTPPPTIARYHPHSLVAGSLSKCCALTGLRLGWLAGPTEAIAAATKAHQFINTAASTFSQRVGISILSDSTRISAHRAEYSLVRARLLAAAGAHGVGLIPPEGAFYAFVRLPPQLADSVRAAERILDELRVVTVPGKGFGDAGEGWLRISWVAPPDAVEEALRRIGEWFRSAGDAVPRLG